MEAGQSLHTPMVCSCETLNKLSLLLYFTEFESAKWVVIYNLKPIKEKYDVWNIKFYILKGKVKTLVKISSSISLYAH